MVVIVVLTLATLFIIRTVRENKLADSVADPQTKFGLLVDQVSVEGLQYLIPTRKVFKTGLTNEEVPSITDPEYTSIAQADSRLAFDVLGVSIEVNDQAYFYPFQALNWHHVVEDEIDGTRLAVTYNPLCMSERVYELPEDVSLDYSGEVYYNHALLKDQDGSLWLQENGVAVVGEEVNNRLQRYPSVLMTWDAWQKKYPDGQVMSLETGHDRDYGIHPFGTYDTSDLTYFPFGDVDNRVAKKWRSYILPGEQESIAFAHKVMQGAGVANTELEGRPVVSFLNRETDVVRVYSAVVDGDPLLFSYNSSTKEITDNKTGSVWSPEGVAISGTYEGTRLTELTTQHQLWFCSTSLYPDSQVYKVDLEDKNN